MRSPVVVDTNILFAALRSANRQTRRILYRDDVEFFAPKFIIVEIFEHKERIVSMAKAPPEEVYEFLDDIIQRITFVSNEFISLANYIEAYRLCKDVDENDTPFLALVLELNAKLWSKDEALKNHLISLGFNNFFTDQ
jgi:predicted nucleic acid-binding protein